MLDTIMTCNRMSLPWTGECQDVKADSPFSCCKSPNTEGPHSWHRLHCLSMVDNAPPALLGALHWAPIIVLTLLASPSLMISYMCRCSTMRPQAARRWRCWARCTRRPSPTWHGRATGASWPPRPTTATAGARLASGSLQALSGEILRAIASLPRKTTQHTLLLLAHAGDCARRNLLI